MVCKCWTFSHCYSEMFCKILRISLKLSSVLSHPTQYNNYCTFHLKYNQVTNLRYSRYTACPQNTNTVFEVSANYAIISHSINCLSHNSMHLTLPFLFILSQVSDQLTFNSFLTLFMRLQKV